MTKIHHAAPGNSQSVKSKGKSRIVNSHGTITKVWRLGLAAFASEASLQPGTFQPLRHQLSRQARPGNVVTSTPQSQPITAHDLLQAWPTKGCKASTRTRWWLTPLLLDLLSLSRTFNIPSKPTSRCHACGYVDEFLLDQSSHPVFSASLHSFMFFTEAGGDCTSFRILLLSAPKSQRCGAYLSSRSLL